MNATERHMLSEVERVSNLLGLPEVRVAQMLGSEAQEIAREDRRREAQREAAVEAAQDAAWAHRHANVEMGLPADTSMAERLAMLYPDGAEPSRDPRAPYGSAANPAFLVSTADGGVIDVGYRAQQSAQRSFSQAHDDALLARARELASDSFMAIQRSQYRSRRARAAERAAVPAAAGTRGGQAGYEASGLGWPEIVR